MSFMIHYFVVSSFQCKSHTSHCKSKRDRLLRLEYFRLVKFPTFPMHPQTSPLYNEGKVLVVKIVFFRHVNQLFSLFMYEYIIILAWKGIIS